MHQHNHDYQVSERIGLAFLLNFIFTIIEFIGGWLTNSTAIMADAVHDLGDTLSIGMAWVLGKLSNKAPNTDFTYGYQRLSLLGALINGAVLVTGSIWILWEAIPRLVEPEMPHAQGMFWLAVLGVCVNGYAAFKLSAGKTLNERILNWHLIEDALGWSAVLFVSIILLFVEWPILDPILSIAFTLYILTNVVKNTYTTVKIFLQGVPDKTMRKEVLQKLQSLDHVADIHHLHLWSLDGEHHVLTAHLVLDSPLNSELQLKVKIQVESRLSQYNFSHTTIEFEQPEEICRDA